MKKISAFAAFAAILSVCACNKNEGTDDGSPKKIDFTAVSSAFKSGPQVNRIRICTASDTVHDNRTDCKLSFVRLCACLTLNQRR